MEKTDRWTHSFPTFSKLDDAAQSCLESSTRSLAFPPGTRVFCEGSPCRDYLMLISGEMRVQKVGENGREITLYRIEPGDTCIVTTSCMMSGQDYTAEGIAETAIVARALPLEAFRLLLSESVSFRDFVFQAYGSRIADLLTLIDEVTFGSIGRRLAARLLARAECGVVTATHYQVAAELGTAREVVSRQLKDFERRGLVILTRGVITLANADGLQSESER